MSVIRHTIPTDGRERFIVQLEREADKTDHLFMTPTIALSVADERYFLEIMLPHLRLTKFLSYHELNDLREMIDEVMAEPSDE